MTTKLSKLERVPLRAAWKHEATDFTPWLAQEENLTSLADVLELPELALVATEHWVGDFKLDILCSSDEEQVIIENQLEKTNHNHLGQILTYAAGTDARKVIWVAESFRPEHIAALEFLNQNTTENLGFFAVEIELWRIGESPLAPKFEVVVKPNNWAKTGREQVKAASQATPTKQLQLRLWTELVEKINKVAPHIKPQKPRPQNWLTISIGRAGFNLNPTANYKDDKLGVEIYIHHKDSKQMFQSLELQKAEIEEALGFNDLDWQELEGAHACRIASWRPDSPLEDEAQWPEYLDWFTDRIIKMNAVFKPILQGLP